MRSLFTFAAACFFMLNLATDAQAQPSGQPPPGYGQQPPTPGYGQPSPYGYGQPSGYRPVEAVAPPAPAREEPSCCTTSIRINPFDLIFKRVSLEGEFAIPTLPLSIEVAPSYVFGIPGSKSDGYDASGFDIGGKVGVWFEGQALRGWFGKAVFDYQHLSLKSDYAKVSYGDPVYGLMIGDQTVFGHDGGFTLSAAIGIGFSPSATNHLLVVGPQDPDGHIYICDNGASSRQISICSGGDKVRFLGQFALGYTF